MKLDSLWQLAWIGLALSGSPAQADRGGVSGGGGEDPRHGKVVQMNEKETYVECTNGKTLVLDTQAVQGRFGLLILQHACDSRGDFREIVGEPFTH